MNGFFKLVCIALLFFPAITVCGQSRYTCPKCKGEKYVPKPCPAVGCHKGTILCTECNGSGAIEHSCSSCNGSGTITKSRHLPCSHCHGKGGEMKRGQIPCTNARCKGGKIYTKSRIPGTHGRDSEKKAWYKCTTCDGTGYVNGTSKIACRYCGGTGEEKETSTYFDGTETRTVYTPISKTENYTVKCESCDGSGGIKEKCSKCEGSGNYLCTRCDGYANVREVCSRCNGNGVIDTYDAPQTQNITSSQPESGTSQTQKSTPSQPSSSTNSGQQKVCTNPQCHGGSIYCDDCDYTGFIYSNGKKEKCPKCKGIGKYVCSSCGGKGAL